MAIYIKTKYSQELVESIRRSIDEGVVDTWSYDEDGDFTHTGQWKNKAWFSPMLLPDNVVFYVIGRKAVVMTRMEYAIYHGRFVEMLLNHFPQFLDELKVTRPHESKYDTDNIEK